MFMHWVDWIILILFVIFISGAAWYTKRFTRSVVDFLSAHRVAGKYLLGIGDDMASFGAITMVAMFEVYYKAGFTAIWWQNMILPVTVILAMTGFIQYRYRETKAMTMGQFFEMRYSKKFRTFAGLLAFLAGIINFAIFPSVGARFFQYFMGLPTNNFITFGSLQIDVVYLILLITLIGISLAFTLAGGQIAVMVTDFIQGTFLNIIFVVIGFFILFTFGWDQISSAILSVPINASMINPMKSGDVENFNISFFLIMAFGFMYNFMAWQGGQGYYGAARSPHEARMGRVVSKLRSTTQNFPLVLLAIAAFTLLHNIDFADQAAKVNTILNSIGDPQLRSQVTVTVSISQILPIGLFGVFAAVIFSAFVANHDTYLHSWGVIFIQDVLLPIRQIVFKNSKPLSQKEHMRWLRISVIGVAIFIFIFSLLFEVKQDILMYFALTGSIFLGWAGSVIIGGLYWKYGNTKGAWAAATIGVILALSGWFAIYQWQITQSFFHSIGIWDWLVSIYPKFAGDKFPINAQILYFYTMLITITTYVSVSYITGRKNPFDLEALLNRKATDNNKPKERFMDIVKNNAKEMFGWDKEFSFADKAMFVFSYGYIFIFFGIFLIGTLYALNTEVADSVWLSYWQFYLWFVVILSAIITVWLAIGGYIDLFEMFRRLKNAKTDESDDGTINSENN